MSQWVLDRFELIAPYGDDGVVRRWVARNAEPREGEPVLVGVTGFPAAVSASTRLQQLARYEADLIEQLRHPNIARTHEYGLDRDCMFFVTDLPIGETFASIWERALMYDERIPAAIAVQLVHDVALTLHHAHTQRSLDGLTLNAVHAGISPDRLVVRPDGTVLVTDFGIAKVLRKANDMSDGQASELANSYRAPEQVQEKAVGPSTDVFLLGVVLWELLSLQRLYPEETDRREISIVAEEPAAPSDFNAALTTTLDRAVLKALEKQPSHRFGDAKVFAEALEPFHRAMPHAGTIEDYLAEHFVDRVEVWKALQTALAEDDLHAALIAAKGTLV